MIRSIKNIMVYFLKERYMWFSGGDGLRKDVMKQMERLTLDEAIKHAKEVAKINRAEATYNFPNLKEYYDNC